MGHRPSSFQQRREPSSRLAGSGSTRKGTGPYLYDFPGQGAANAGGAGARAQLQLIADMRANMQVHRQLSSVMEEQVSLFGGLRPPRQHQQGQQRNSTHSRSSRGGSAGTAGRAPPPLPQQHLGGGGAYLGAFGLEDYDAGDGAGEASEAGAGAGLGLGNFDASSPAKMLDGWTDSDDFGLFAFLDGESITSPQPPGGDA